MDRKQREKIRKISILALTLCPPLVLAGCRPSPMLSRNVYDYLDPFLTTESIMENDDEDADEEKDRFQMHESEEADREEQELTAGAEKEGADSADQTPELAYAQDAQDSDLGAAAQNPESTSNDSDASVISDSQTDTNQSGESGAAGGAASDSADNSAGTGNESSSEDTDASELEGTNGAAEDETLDRDTTNKDTESGNYGGTKDDKKNIGIVDDGGDKDENGGGGSSSVTPSLVSGDGRIAAVGEAATLVCMLAGADRLCATSESFADNSLAQQAFPVDTSYSEEEGYTEDGCAVLWDDEGDSPISDEDFETLLEIAPETCFYSSGHATFTDSQIGRLEEAGVQVVCLPDFDSIDEIETAVEAAADCLGEEAEAKAEDYLAWCADLNSELSGLSAMETCYIADWDSSATTTVSNSSGDVLGTIQDGAAVIRVGTDWDRVFLEYAEEYAKVTDRAKAPVGNNGTTHNAITWSASGDYGSTENGSLCLISALHDHDGDLLTVSGSYEPLTGYSTVSEARWTATQLATEFLFGLGYSGFPGVICSSYAVADAIENSTLWDTSICSTSNSGWFSTLYGRMTVPVYKVYDGTRTYSNILADYGVYVQPAGGVGSWIEGSPESVLEAVWAANVLSGYNTDSMYGWIEDFYSTFYGLDVSAGWIDANVLAGN